MKNLLSSLGKMKFRAIILNFLACTSVAAFAVADDPLGVTTGYAQDSAAQLAQRAQRNEDHLAARAVKYSEKIGYPGKLNGRPERVYCSMNLISPLPAHPESGLAIFTHEDWEPCFELCLDNGQGCYVDMVENYKNAIRAIKGFCRLSRSCSTSR